MGNFVVVVVVVIVVVVATIRYDTIRYDTMHCLHWKTDGKLPA